MAAPRFRSEPAPFAVPAKWLFADQAVPVVPADYPVTKLAARGRAPSQQMRAKGGTKLDHAEAYYGVKMHKHNARA